MTSIEQNGPNPSIYHTHISTDNGASWQAATMNISQFEFANEKWYGSQGNSIFESTDGINWNNPTTFNSLLGLKSYENAVYVFGWDGAINSTFDFTSSSIHAQSSNQFLVFPNPINSTQELTINAGNDRLESIIIRNMQGQIVHEALVYSSVTSIDLELPAGLYFIEGKSREEA